ncbi:hypothetical protein V8C34DRAFT_283738 [Trichoderma compactum]
MASFLHLSLSLPPLLYWLNSLLAQERKSIAVYRPLVGVHCMNIVWHTRLACQDLLSPRFVSLCSWHSALNAEIDGQSPLGIACCVTLLVYVCFLRLPEGSERA